MIKEKKIPYKVLNCIDGLTEQMEKDKSIMAFFMFGGAVEGELKPLSDLDFAVLLDNSITVKELFEKELELRDIISGVLKTDEFDLIILNTAPNNFVKNIINKGKLLFSNDKNKLRQFVETTVMEYLDFLYYRNQFLNTFREKIGIE